MSQMTSNVMNALSALAEEYAEAKAGNVVKRPPNGDWASLVKKMEITTDGVELFVGDDLKVPGVRIDFTYAMMGGELPIPPTFKEGEDWFGRSFVLPLKGIKGLPAAVTENKRTNIRISLERFKGNLKTILGDSYTDALVPDMQAAQALIAEAAVVVLARCKSSVKADKSYFEETLVSRLS